MKEGFFVNQGKSSRSKIHKNVPFLGPIVVTEVRHVFDQDQEGLG